MRRKAPRKSTVGISLFPFLAVLICTMGALIVLLVIVVQQARVQAATAEQGKDPPLDADQEARQVAWEDQHWRAEVLEEQRVEIQRQLASKRLEIAHLEQHIRELEDRWKLLKSEVDEMQRMRVDKQSGAAALKDEIDALKQRLAVTQQEVQEAQQRALERRRTYTIVPYPGPHGTTRRPIYVECTERGIVLQPENIVLRPDDFEGSLGPGNPLDAALRTIREYYAQHQTQPIEEPYPLLVIRPQGVAGYAVAREAMSGWEDEFGYELVSDELQLNFPPPDPALAALLQKAVADARQRQALLRRAMPANPRGSGFIVSEGRGGVVPLDGGALGAGSGVGRGRGGTGNGRGSAGEHTANTGTGASGGSRGGGSPADAHSGATAAGQQGAAGASQGSGNQGSGANAANSANSSNGSPQVGANPGGGSGMNMQYPSSMANTRGPDWALENKSATATGYRRPVRVVCDADRLVLVAEPGSGQPPLEFAYEQDPTRAVDQFVQALRTRMNRWGLAPVGGYWRPQLKIAVTPAGEQRFELLQHLLQDSGLELVRDNP